jgi:hypothetical protein
MGTKRTAKIVGVLCGIFLVFGMRGRIVIAGGGEGESAVPKVEGTGQEQREHFEPVQRIGYKTDPKDAQLAATTKRSLFPEAPLKETVAGVVARKALPWVAGILGLAGLVMVVFGFLSRRRPSPNQMARSMTLLRVSDAAPATGTRSSQPKLASNLVRTEMPPLEIFADRPKEPPTRRAA